MTEKKIASIKLIYNKQYNFVSKKKKKQYNFVQIFRNF